MGRGHNSTERDGDRVTMGLGNNGTAAQWDGGIVERKGMGMGIQQDYGTIGWRWGIMGRGHNGTRDQWDGGTIGRKRMGMRMQRD